METKLHRVLRELEEYIGDMEHAIVELQQKVHILEHKESK